MSATEVKKILVAEDEVPIANALEAKLRKNGFEVKTVNDGMEALTELEKGAWDVLLLDLMMPRMDGFTVLEKIKGKNIKTIVISNLYQDSEVKKAKELGAVEYIVKANTPLSEIVDHVSKLAYS